MASVQIRQVFKDFGQTKVLRGVDIHIDDGSFCVLVGPSGCGKSTLLRLIAGLEEIDSGDIQIGERVVNRIPPKDRDIAMVFQNYALYPHMTVAQNMGFSLKLAGQGKSEMAARVVDAAQILGLETLLDRYPRQLSGGQRQRVAMGRAIVRNPQVFLFDEPLSNLDAKLRVQMRAEIKELHHRLKTTAVYVTHDQIEAMTMADQIVVMNEGVIEQIGAPLELYDRPAKPFVASFIGSPAMNLIAARLDPAGFLQLPGSTRWTAPAIDPRSQATITEVQLGVRPEHLQCCPPEQANALAGKVSVVEPTGADTLVHVKTEAGDLVALFRERRSFSVGEVIGLCSAP
ncbi:MAG: sn-glycerol-3-phosphate ABC transporter ATP-binding protein UgpC, partial [Betaproteobacteria bacterium]|nr:sn-glycerol-3-phosphate ABC transporter ATP-binding protein UgpC [Betaproteobacteria bacterium]